jgi:hypothetical protein
MAAEDVAAASTSRAERDEARRRRAQQAAAEGERPAPRGRRGRYGTAERPPAPWGSFPLSELCVFLALVLGIAGLVVRGNQGRTMLLAAFALGSLAGLELSIREHFAGYRSHSSLLAGATTFAVVTVVLIVAGSFGGVVLGAVVVVGVVVFAGAFYGFRELFKSRSGGLGFR